MRQAPIYDIWRILSLSRAEAEAEVRACCQTSYLGDHESLCRILGRYKMFVDTRDIGIAAHLMLEGYWEMWVTEAMMRLVRRGSVVADIGANHGYFTLLLADLTGPEGRVLSFEPNPNLARRLRKSIAVNGFAGWTDFYDIALGAEEDVLAMSIIEDLPGGATMQSLGQRLDDDAPVLARVARFDDIAHSEEVEFIKIDVEGFEPIVWQGMSRLLASDRPLTIFMEFTTSRFDDARGFLAEILGRGFSMEIVTFFDGVQPITADELFALPGDVDNMLVFRRGIPEQS